MKLTTLRDVKYAISKARVIHVTSALGVVTITKRQASEKVGNPSLTWTATCYPLGEPGDGFNLLFRND